MKKRTSILSALWVWGMLVWGACAWANTPDTLLYQRAPMGAFNFRQLPDSQTVVVRHHANRHIVHQQDHFTQRTTEYFLLRSGARNQAVMWLHHEFKRLKNKQGELIPMQVMGHLLNTQQVVGAFTDIAFLDSLVCPTGQWIELLIQYEEAANFMADFVFQTHLPKLGGSLTVKSPTGWQWQTKSLAKNLIIQKSETNDSASHFKVVHGFLPAVPRKAPFFNPNLHRAQVLYYFERNPGYPANFSLYNWNEAASRFYKYWNTLNPKAEKIVRKILRSAKLRKKPKNQHAQLIEQAFKLKLQRMYAPPNQSANQAHWPTPFDAVGILGLALQKAGIEFRFGVAATHFFPPLDEDFSHWDFLSEGFVYLPQTQQFIFSNYNYLTTTYLPPQHQGQKAMMILPMEFEKTGRATALFKKLPEDAPKQPLLKHHVQAQINNNNRLMASALLTSKPLAGASFLLKFILPPQPPGFDSVYNINTKSQPPYALSDTHNLSYSISDTGQLCQKVNDTIVVSVGKLLYFPACHPKAPFKADTSTNWQVNLPEVIYQQSTVALTLPNGYKPITPPQLNFSMQATDTTTQATMRYALSTRQTNNLLKIQAQYQLPQLNWPAHLRPAFLGIQNKICELKELKIHLIRE